MNIHSYDFFMIKLNLVQFQVNTSGSLTTSFAWFGGLSFLQKPISAF